MEKKNKYDEYNRKGLACTISGFTCDYLGRRQFVKDKPVLNRSLTIAGLGLNVCSFAYYLKALGELGSEDGVEDTAFINHLLGSVIFPTASAIHLAKSFRKH